MSWQRRLRIGFAALFLGLIVVIAWSLRSRTTPPPSAPTTRVDPAAAVELPQGADIVWTEKGREVFTLKFARALTYADGRSVFTEADVTVPDRGGRTVHISAKEAEVFTPPGQPRRVDMRGNVVLTASDGLKLSTDSAAYHEAERILRIPGAFTFSRGDTSGSGRGATYDQDADVFVIRDAARVTVTPGEGGTAMDIEAGTATMDRRGHVTRFERHATVKAGTQTTVSETLVAFLSDDNERISRIELRGGARLTEAEAAPGALRSMQGREIDLAYAEDGRTLQRAVLRGGSALEIAGSGADGRRLAAETIDAGLGADGRVLQRLSADQRVQLDLPAEADAPARRIQSAALRGTGDAEGLRDVTFTGDVRYRETRAAPPAEGRRAPAAPSERAARSDRLDATLAPGLGAPEAAVFRGRVRIRDGATSAEAGVANYAPARNLMTLHTPADTPGGGPRVADEQVTVSAAWIEMTLAPRRLHAKGDVRSVLQQDPAEGTPAPGSRKRPAMLRGDEPVNVTAAELQYDGDASRGVYSGGARLWQGETTIQGDELVIDDAAGNLTATRQVRTRMMIERQDAKTKRSEVTESIGSAETFVYEDARRRAVYEGRAHLTGPQGDVTARRIELFLDEDGRTLERAEAYDDVDARLQGGQHAFGARLTYYGADERYVVTGSPVRIFEPVEGGCRESLGASLTFVRSTDTISIVGTEGNRSRTMPGSCPERVR